MSLDTVSQPTSVVESNLQQTGEYDFDRFKESVMDTYARFPIALERGAGCRVWDTTGKEYLDLVAGIATCT
ncbi:aspartate aminotransferase family protein, partial [Chroococcidiopsidales cyanobacterium LEGE 13417]|nr:aspartate aminotransferase family protein [Chroococcidiopsidales cyanobacterium LEGE 13417]